MKAASVKEIKTELKELSQDEIINLCLRLSRFKKENKELLTYLLFESHHEDEFVTEIKSEIDEYFEAINLSSAYYVKKSIRKILRLIKKYIRYSDVKETEVELLLYFCKKTTSLPYQMRMNRIVQNIKNREINTIQKKILLLHEDLQYDYQLELEDL